MRLEIRVRDGEVASALSDHIERRLAFALGRFGGQVVRVTVTLEDLNGPRGGMDQRCRIAATLTPSEKVLAAATDASAETAVNRAAERIARRVRDTLDRRRTGGRRNDHQPSDSGEA